MLEAMPFGLEEEFTKMVKKDNQKKKIFDLCLTFLPKTTTRHMLQRHHGERRLLSSRDQDDPLWGNGHDAQGHLEGCGSG